MNAPLSRRTLFSQAILCSAAILTLSACGGASTSSASVASPATTPETAPTPQSGSFQWKPLRIGAGGFVTGIDIAPDGTKVVRNDSAGAFIWSTEKNEWKPLLTRASMPTSDWGFEANSTTGVYEVAIAASDTRRIYVAYNGGVYRTNDKGVTFSKTSLPHVSASGNDEYRYFGRKMAVDPINADFVVLGTQTDGLFVSNDGGANWALNATIPKAVTGNGMRVAFDQSSSVQNGRTSRLYVSSSDGVYVSSNAGASFTLIPGSPKPLQHLVCGKDGTLWATDTTGGPNIWRYRQGVWLKTTPDGATPFKTIAVDPGNSAHIVVASAGGGIAQSFDTGATWTGIYYPNYPANSGRRVAEDIPWLAWTNETYMSSGEMAFDPSANNKLFFAEGIGVWWSNPPTTYVGFDWNSQSKGIEQLVSNQFLAPPGGTPLYLAWDRPLFRLENLDQYPKTHGPNNADGLMMGWSADYSPSNSAIVVSIMNWWGKDVSGISTDGGETWTKFASLPGEILNGKIGGSIAAGGDDNFVWIPGNNASGAWYTKDRGRTWAKSNIEGAPTSDPTGWGWSYFLHRVSVTADKVSPNTFYAYNYLTGVYRSSDGGANFSLVHAGEVAAVSGNHAKLISVPGQRGHLFFASGQEDGPNPGQSKMMRSRDGGVSWTPVAGMTEVAAFGFGKAAPGSSYPAIFVSGYYNGRYSIWRSDDDAATWVDLGAYPLSNADEITTLSGDLDTYGRIYIGFGGSGGVYGEFAPAVASVGR